MKKLKQLSLTTVLALPVFLAGCEQLFVEDNQPGRHYGRDSYYHYYDSGDYDGGGGSNRGSRSYGRGGSSSKPRSDRPSTSATADSIESAEVPVEPPAI